MKNHNQYWAVLVLSLWLCISSFAQPKRPNVIMIITDDQGYGDLGFHGNPNVQTPVLYKFAGESIHFNNFYVSPVCAPTRSGLMTGRYSLRTGVRDTYNGGAIIHTDEITIAEMLKQANYPSRPMDQEFDESVIHLTGGMGQVGDFTTYFQGDRSYFDPILWHNGKQEAYQGLRVTRMLHFSAIYPLMHRIPHYRFLTNIMRCTGTQIPPQDLIPTIDPFPK